MPGPLVDYLELQAHWWKASFWQLSTSTHSNTRSPLPRWSESCFIEPSAVFERPVRGHLRRGYVALLPALLFLWDPEKFSSPGVWCSGAEKGKEQEDISTIWKSKTNVLVFFGRGRNWYVVSCVLGFEEVKRRQPWARRHAGRRLK